MDGFTMLMVIAIVIGCAMFLLGTFKARDYVDHNVIGFTSPSLRGLRGMLWIVFAACGALQIFTSIEVMARLNEKEADLIRRRTIVASLDGKIHVYRKGLKSLQGTVSHVKNHPGGSPEKLIDELETMLAEIRDRERKLP